MTDIVLRVHYRAMRLQTYLRLRHLTDAKFAAMVGRDRSTVTKWRNGKIWPDWSAMRLIFEATAGAVTPNDFMDIRSAVVASEAAE